MYIPIMKNRKRELAAAENLSNLFDESLIPYFEIISDSYSTKYEVDSEGNYVRNEQKTKSGVIRQMRIKLPHTEEDINTLETIKSKIGNKKAFIDFFRFSIPDAEYTNFSFEAVVLSYNLSQDFSEYKKRVLGIAKFDNFIPVISIKKGLLIGTSDFRNIISEMQNKFSSIAIRITSELFDDYRKDIQSCMRSNDYFFYDIRSSSVQSKRIEMMELKNYTLPCPKILLNSPRPIDKNNGEYEKSKPTILINNDAIEKYASFKFDGVGDFAGLKDELPKAGGSGGAGTALSLMYNNEDNKFYSFKCDDSSIGMKGYRVVVNDILSNLDMLGNIKNCPAIDKIALMKRENKYGNWSTWNEMTITRYIHQLYSKEKAGV